MKITHKFTSDENKIYEIPEEKYVCLQDVIDYFPKIVTFMDKTWEWFMYDHKENNITLLYAQINTNPVFAPIVATGIVGPVCPKTIDCECGSSKCGHPGHSEWCDVLNKNGWDEAIKEYVNRQVEDYTLLDNLDLINYIV